MPSCTQPQRAHPTMQQHLTAVHEWHEVTRTVDRAVHSDRLSPESATHSRVKTPAYPLIGPEASTDRVHAQARARAAAASSTLSSSMRLRGVCRSSGRRDDAGGSSRDGHSNRRRRGGRRGYKCHRYARATHCPNIGARMNALDTTPFGRSRQVARGRISTGSLALAPVGAHHATADAAHTDGAYRQSLPDMDSRR